MTSRLLIVLIMIALTACSHTGKKSSKKTYSEQTQKSFEDIERDNAINKYRQLRWEQWNKKKKGKIKTIRPKKYSKKKAPKKKKIIQTDPKEQMIEIDQNLKFFCMEKRKDSRFSQAGKCESFTNDILQKCEIKFSWNDRNLMKCVKSKLR